MPAQIMWPRGRAKRGEGGEINLLKLSHPIEASDRLLNIILVTDRYVKTICWSVQI